MTDSPTPPAIDPKVQQDRQFLADARQRGPVALIGAFVKLSGPGWLQSAITLGGGSLAGSLYLGVLAGFSLMWLQPLAMILGVIMLSAIGYVTLSTGERPFRAINSHVNPVLGWGWAIATMMANMVWCMPQFALGTAAMQQNLAPHALGTNALPDPTGKLVCIAILFVVSFTIVWFYNAGGWGIKVFDTILKIMVGVVVLCFFGVVFELRSTLDWGNVFSGFIPNFKLLSEPAPTWGPILEATGAYAGYWHDLIVSQQRDVMITAAATAVGINMTFLLPYSMLKKGWDRDFRGLAIFDLSTGLFIPFVLAISCVVIASASQFHVTPAPGLLGELDASGKAIVAPANLQSSFDKLMDGRATFELNQQANVMITADLKKTTIGKMPEADRRVAAMLVTRDSFDLAGALEPLTGHNVAQLVFGVGVLGMAVSTIIILMLINGFVMCEMLGYEQGGWMHRFGCALAGLSGAMGPFVFQGDAKFWLAVPTSVFGMVLLPIAYITFFAMMNNRTLMGDFMPRGGKRLAWNLLMIIAIGLALVGSMYSVWSKTHWVGLGAVGVFAGLALIVHFVRPPSKEKLGG
ncbi:MAG: hypothetical protein GC162_10230 [Planctomycetes bacterium]|nr:hypothetical protein [Planctomycetota bacterium]